MLRRTHKTLVFDAKLVDLPKPTEHTVWLDFNKIEKCVYDIVRARFISRINCIAKSGNLDKQYKYVAAVVRFSRNCTEHFPATYGSCSSVSASSAAAFC